MKKNGEYIKKEERSRVGNKNVQREIKYSIGKKKVPVIHPLPKVRGKVGFL